jgi:hypothetical protein
MLRHLLPCLALILATLAFPAQAEKLPAEQIDLLRANFAQECHTTTSLITPSWLLPGEAEQVCGCSDTKIVAQLQTADFADPANLSKADHKRIEDIGTNAAGECLQPFFAKGVTRMATRQCVANAPGIPVLRSLPEDKVKSVCSCAAERYTQSADLRDVAQVAAPDGMLMRQTGDLLKPHLESCKSL